MGFYAQVIVPLLCDFGLDRPFLARYRRELLAHASGNILEIGFGIGLNLPCYPSHVRKVTTVDPCATYVILSVIGGLIYRGIRASDHTR
jgi:hypothetical protein